MEPIRGILKGTVEVNLEAFEIDRHDYLKVMSKCGGAKGQPSTPQALAHFNRHSETPRETESEDWS